MLATILGIIQSLAGFGETVRSITNAITNVQIAKVKAGTEEKKIEADAELEALKARRDVLIAEAPGSRVNQLLRVFLSLPAVVLLWKIVVIDIVLKLGSTDQPSQYIWSYVLAVIGFYLLNRTIQLAKK